MAYLALYRRWRPQDFSALVGQQAVKQALTNALNAGRIAHAYLFSGPRGTGKTSTARILARALNCEAGPTAQPCGQCVCCREIADGASLDVLEIDAASNRGIDEIKALREQLAFNPVNSRYKVYIIDEVHMLTREAFNALLKSLEEPPAHVIFILATTDPQRIPATIHSRCQRYEFQRVTPQELAAHLAAVAAASGIQADAAALNLIAAQAEGGVRDALSLLDQCSVMDERLSEASVRSLLGIVGVEAIRQMAGAIANHKSAEALASLEQLLAQGKEVKQILAELSDYLRALLLYQTAPGYKEIYLTDTAEALAATAALFTPARLLAAQERLHAAAQELRFTLRPRITAEVCLLDLAREGGSLLSELVARVERLEANSGAAEQQAPRRPKQTSAAASANEAGSNSANVTAAPKIQEVTPQATVTPQQEQAAQSIEASLAEGSKYWQEALAYVSEQKKFAIITCAKRGRVTGFTNDVLRVAFGKTFYSSRMQEADYRGYFEDVLLRIARRPIKLNCVTESAPPESARVQPKPQEAAAATATLPPSLVKGLAVLGGTVTAQEE